MKYNVNDRVKVREDLELNKMYGGISLLDDMYEILKGHSIVIIQETDEIDGAYEIIGGNDYSYSEEMFSGLADEPTQSEPNRLEIASRIMAALIMANYKWSPSDMAKESLKHTDALITELNKAQTR